MDGDWTGVLQSLDAPDENVVADALLALGEMGVSFGNYSDLIAPKLRSSAKKVQNAALYALGCMGEHASKHIGSVEAFLNGKDADLTAQACTALGYMKASSSAPKLIAKLSDPVVEVAAAACGALSAMDSSGEDVKKLLGHQEPRLRAAAVNALKGMSQAESFATAAAPLVGDDNCLVRVAAAEMVRSLGPKAAGCASILGQFLRQKDTGVVAASAAALAGIGEAGAAEAATLEALLDNKGVDNSSLPLSTAGVCPKVAPVFRKPACAAAAALGAMGSAGAKSAGKLADGLKDKDEDMRAACLTALGALGKEGAKFEAEAMQALSDSAPKVVAAAAGALGAMAAATSGSESPAEAVAELCASQSPLVRAAAAKSLGMMGEAGSGYIAEVVKLFGDASSSVKVEAVKALAGLGELGQMYAGAVCQAPLYDGSVEVRVAACATLAAMGSRGAAFTEEVEGLLEDPVPDVRSAAAKALEGFSALAALEAPEPAPVGKDGAPLLPVALMFPGQGSQYVKMLAEVQDIPAVQEMLAKAKDILGYDVLDLCLNGPEEKLEQTKFCQPAMYIGGLAAVESLKKDKPECVERCRQLAGLSLGEYTALTVAGVFDFETGLKLVKLRGEAMQEAAEASPQKMLSVAGLDQPTIDKLCQEVAATHGTCQVANFLFPKGFSCAGSKEAIEKLEEKALATEGCLQAKQLKISGAFHTSFMEPAKLKLMEALKQAEPNMKPPRCEVYMNATATKISPGTPPADIIPMLGNQLCSCVLWEPTIKAMIKDGITEFYECGPMKQLKAMMKRINMDVWKNTTNIHV